MEHPVRSQYLTELDGVRAFSILFVLATHMLPVGLPEWQLNTMTGPMGMSLFFCLSGFLITRFLWDRPEIGEFLKRRIARIYPLMALYGFIVCVLLAGRWDAYAGLLLIFRNYADSLVLPYSSHLWSLCLELQFYIGIAIAVFLAGRRAFWLLPLGCLIVLYFRFETGSHANIRTHIRIDEILVGGILAIIWLTPDHRLSRMAISLMSRAFWLILPLWLISSHKYSGEISHFRAYFAMILVGSVIFRREGAIRQFLRIKPLRYLAAISYALYVWHPLTMYGWLGEGGLLEKYLLKRPISFFLTFFLAHMSTFAFEKYFTDKAKGKPADAGLAKAFFAIPWLPFGRVEKSGPL